MVVRNAASVASPALVCLCALTVTCGIQAASIPAGFTPLFNGKDLSGWHVSRTAHHGSTPHAAAREGAIELGQNPYGQGGLLVTDKRYRDFELVLEVKAPWGCNSGIFLRSTEGGSAYQIELDQGRGTGGFFGENLHVSKTAGAPSLQNHWKNGDWNAFRIRMTGAAPRVTEWINGVQVVDVQQPRNDKIGGETDGMIGLQAHWAFTYQPASGSFNLPLSWKPGALYRFRNIAIKELSPRALAVTKATAKVPIDAAGMEFVLIHPGSMQVAVYEPVCPTLSSPAVLGEPGSPVNPQILWTPANVKLCENLVKQVASQGFRVTIAKPFYIGKYEVTQTQWTREMGTNPSVFQGTLVQDDAQQHPVDSVTWEDAQSFVRKLNQREHTRRYRLPTEFEWEYSGRAGGSGQVGWDQIRSQAVQGLRADAGNGLPPTTQRVGSKQPNAWGLYDMLGNVWEWVEDGYNEKTFPDPRPPQVGNEHVLKGGGFLSDVKNVIYATHGAGPADKWDVGFRIVKEVEP